MCSRTFYQHYCMSYTVYDASGTLDCSATSIGKCILVLYTTSCGLTPVEVLGKVLSASSTYGNFSHHASGSEWQNARNNYSTLCIVRSVYPSVYGWKAVDIFKLVPSSRINSFQNLAVNRGSRSDTIDSGIPCKRTILFKYVLAQVVALVSNGNGIKCVCLLNLSTTTNTESPPTLFYGISVIKSILMCYQGLSGTGSGYNFPVGLPGFGFTRWHKSQ